MFAEQPAPLSPSCFPNLFLNYCLSHHPSHWHESFYSDVNEWGRLWLLLCFCASNIKKKVQDIYTLFLCQVFIFMFSDSCIGIFFIENLPCVQKKRCIYWLEQNIMYHFFIRRMKSDSQIELWNSNCSGCRILHLLLFHCVSGKKAMIKAVMGIRTGRKQSNDDISIRDSFSGINARSCGSQRTEHFVPMRAPPYTGWV